MCAKQKDVKTLRHPRHPANRYWIHTPGSGLGTDPEAWHLQDTLRHLRHPGQLTLLAEEMDLFISFSFCEQSHVPFAVAFTHLVACTEKSSSYSKSSAAARRGGAVLPHRLVHVLDRVTVLEALPANIAAGGWIGNINQLGGHRNKTIWISKNQKQMK